MSDRKFGMEKIVCYKVGSSTYDDRDEAIKEEIYRQFIENRKHLSIIPAIETARGLIEWLMDNEENVRLLLKNKVQLESYTRGDNDGR